MEKQNPLLPFAYSTSSKDEIALNTTPRKRSVIDENAVSMYHTRSTGGGNGMERPFLAGAPSLKRKMGESFNEKDDIKRRETEFEEFESEPTVIDDFDEEDDVGDEDKENVYDLSKRRILAPPSSPPLATEPISETDYYGLEFPVQNGPSEFHNERSKPVKDIGNAASLKVLKTPFTNHELSSESDFGIDRFNRFKNPSLNKCPSTDKEEYDLNEYWQSQNFALKKAREKIIDAFENMQTTINLESMNLHDVPDEIKDLDNLVIFNPDLNTQISYQLYLTNNNLKELPPSLFQFTKLNVLGLRSNKLERIPPLIKRLQNLTDLTLGTNRLSFLPYQILELIRLTTFRAGPNPFIEIPNDAVAVTTSTLNSERQRNYISKPYILAPAANHNIPTLKTLCLDKIAKYNVTYQETKSWKKFTPKIFHSLIVEAISKGQYEETCSECDRIVVQPVAEVFEWWNLLQNKNVPIRRQFCCGQCLRSWKSNVQLDLESDDMLLSF